MLCKQCGAALPEDSAFCVNCGAPAEAGAQTPIAETEVIYADNAAAASVEEVPPAPPKKKKGCCGVLLIIGAILGALGLIGGIIALVIILGGIGIGVTALNAETPNVIEDPTGMMENVDHTTIPADQRTYQLDKSNMYYDQFVDADSYMLSSVRDRYYSRSELSGMTRQQIYLAEREMFARYGCTFTDRDLSDYFYAKSWYTPDAPVGNFNESRMTDVELVNLLTLRAMLMEKDGTASSNPYLKANNDVDGWILRGTDAARITKADVKNLDEQELIIAANEIYARKGYIFEDQEMQLYFASKNWYVPSTPAAQFDSSTLTEIESENYTCLQENVEKLRGVKFTNNNRYEDYFYYYGDYVIKGSDTRAIDPYELKGLTHEELVLARNEIYARYGYSFNHAALREYFMKRSWYYPTVIPTKLELIHLSKLELANVKLIQAFELNAQLIKGEAKPNTKMSYYAKHDYMTMYLPAHWQDNCLCVKPGGLSGDLVFYEKFNYQDDGDGWVFSMVLSPYGSSIPSYSGCNTDIYGVVTTPNGDQFYVLKVVPYTRQDDYLEHVYDLMQSQVDTIFNSIVWKSGYTFTKY